MTPLFWLRSVDAACLETAESRDGAHFYCTVRVTVVVCVSAPDVAVTMIEACWGFFELLELPPPPQAVEASSAPAMSTLANAPSSSE